jgi:hypothetical protein
VLLASMVGIFFWAVLRFTHWLRTKGQPQVWVGYPKNERSSNR